MTPRERLEHQIALDMTAIRTAKEGSVPFTRAVSMLRTHTAELDALDAADGKDVDAASLTPEEWRIRIQEDAAQATTEDLEVYVREFYGRLKIRPVHHPDGRVELVTVRAG